MNRPEDHRWHVPVRIDEVPEGGLHLNLVADAAVRAHLQDLAGLHALPRLEAGVDLTREGNALRARGHVSATVGQTCVVTLEPLENQVAEDFDVLFSPASDDAAGETTTQHDGEEPPEALVDGVADIGPVAAEFFLLGIDRYPRKPGAVFAPPAEEGSRGSAFAALAKLKRKDDGEP